MTDTNERMTAEQHADNLDAWADREAQHQPTGELMDAAKCLRSMSIELRDEARYIRKLRTENAALREVVERLPVTSDKVPIEIGQVYFYRDWADDKPPLRSQSVQVRHMRVQMIEIDSDGSVSYSGPCSVPWRAGEAQITIEDPNDLYSTREAALAARKDTTDEE